MENFGPVPLILGVVGHRELPKEQDSLRHAVRELLEHFRRRYPSTKIILLTALAEGADRLVAHEALELGISIVAPLPMERSEYEKDFVSSESLAEFRSLLERAEASFVAPHILMGEIGDARTNAYANCGAYIAGRCAELIALWDGKSSPLGGTAEVVKFMLDGVSAPYVSEEKEFDPSLCGPVHHVLTPRASTGFEADGRAFSIVTRYPRSAAVEPAAAFERVKYDIERFNRDATSGPLSGGLRGMTAREQAEKLANTYQRRTTSSLLAISSAVLLAIVAFNLYTVYEYRPIFLLVGYLFFTGAAFVPYFLSKRGEWQLRYQDYRALEQALRTSEYWHMAGIDRSVASRFAESERTTIDWIPVALRALTEPVGRGNAPATPSAHDLQSVYDEWILGQQRYFAEFAGKREHKRERTSSRLVTAGVVLSIVLTVGSRLGSLYAPLDRYEGPALFVATLLAIGAALVHNFAEKRGWSEHSRHYELMGALFGFAAERIAPLMQESQTDPAAMSQLRGILITLGDEAIRENVSWLNLHRSRPLNVPQI